ncbi:MAG: sigma 54-interacting transcriptional regulator [Myxococcota bacterium]
MSDPRADSEATVTVEKPTGQSGFYLLVLEGRRTRAMALPSGGTIDIGRDESCFVVLDDDSVSRRHAELDLPALTLRDLDSKNGTSVEGESVETATIQPGMLVGVGEVTLIVQRGELPASRSDVPVEGTASVAMQRVLRAVRCVAADDITVLLLGETGVGKEMIAERVHALSERSEAPFQRVHCAALTESLFESELFGHEKGAFTGANAARAGLLESASGGTVFIDEVGEVPPHVQVKLLRVLEDRRVRRVGGREERLVDIRFIAATNRDLEKEVLEGRFRQDLYFRLSGFTIRIPPLRQRRDEIIDLAELFLEQVCAEKKRPMPRMEDALKEALRAYSWPGNVRELKNVMRRLLIVSESDVLRVADLPHEEMTRRGQMLEDDGPRLDSPDERERILAALQETGGNQTAAAKLLGVSRRTLIDRLDKYGIARPRKQ